MNEKREINIEVFFKTSRINASAREVFAWHQSRGALEALIPPWEKVTVEQPPRSLGDGEIAVLVMRVGPIRQRWVARHFGFVDRGDEGGEFCDEQVKGPFAAWVHRHIVRADGAGHCVLEDRIKYELPLGWLGRTFGGAFARRKLERMFEFRHEATRRAVENAGPSQQR